MTFLRWIPMVNPLLHQNPWIDCSAVQLHISKPCSFVLLALSNQFTVQPYSGAISTISHVTLVLYCSIRRGWMRGGLRIKPVDLSTWYAYYDIKFKYSIMPTMKNNYCWLIGREFPCCFSGRIIEPHYLHPTMNFGCQYFGYFTKCHMAPFGPRRMMLLVHL